MKNTKLINLLGIMFDIFVLASALRLTKFGFDHTILLALTGVVLLAKDIDRYKKDKS